MFKKSLIAVGVFALTASLAQALVLVYVAQKNSVTV